MLSNNVYKFPKITSEKKPEFHSIEIKRSNKTNEIKLLREWQKSSFNKLKESNLFLVDAPCGSGKTTMSISMALHDVIKSNRKQLFVVPQSHIGDGFFINGTIKVPEIGTVIYSKPTNFCLDNNELKVDSLINFMTKEKKESYEKYDDKNYFIDGPHHMAVCTHAALNKAFDKINKDNLFDSLKGISFYIDEAHHIKSGECDITEQFNNLGNIVYNLIESNKSNEKFRIGLFTATWQRGDQGFIISNNHMNRFLRYKLDFLDHFYTLGIEEVSVNFVEYEEEHPIEQIVENIEKELDEFHLIVVPPRRSKWRKKDDDIKILLKKLRGMLERKGYNPDEVILNLVDSSTQSKNKKILLSQPKFKKDPNNKIKIIITCMLGREGTDCCQISRIHHSSIELNSITLAKQTLGRMFRPFEGKDNVSVTYYIDKLKSLEDSESKNDFLKIRVDYILYSMIVDDLFNPIILPSLPTFSSREKSKNESRIQNSIKLSDVFKDDYDKVRKELIEKVSICPEFTEEFVNSIIKQVVRDYKIKDKIKVFDCAYTTKQDVIHGLKVFLLRARSDLLRRKNIDISFLRKNGFDYIVKENNLEGNFWFGLNKDKLEQFSYLIKKFTWDESQREEIKNGIIKAVSDQLGRKIDISKNKDFKLCNNMLNELEKIHKTFNELDNVTKENLAEKLNISLFDLNEKIEIFNKVLPKGYRFFEIDSKIKEKILMNIAS